MISQQQPEAAASDAKVAQRVEQIRFQIANNLIDLDTEYIRVVLERDALETRLAAAQAREAGLRAAAQRFVAGVKENRYNTNPRICIGCGYFRHAADCPWVALQAALKEAPDAR